MVVVPSAMPVTSPFPSMLALVGSEDDQALFAAGLADPVSCKFFPTHTELPPEMVGSGFTTNVFTSSVVPQALVTVSLTGKLPALL